MLATLISDCLYVMWPYPNGAVGLEAFQQSIQREERFLARLSDRHGACTQTLYGGLHTVLFRWPGIDAMIRRAQYPAPLDSGGELMRKAVLATRELWGTALAGLKLFCGRLAVLVLCLPLITLMALGGIVDGSLSWYRRRSGGERESGFVYHRAKRYAGYAGLLVGFLYLVPPVTVDPRAPVALFATALALSLRTATGSFKKFL
ncbi:MAG: DUF4400 domain-containing protein [Pseudomonadota bacterium]|nr:DUF4400 domain-containing protein [Pseudomonadota bacterium]